MFVRVFVFFLNPNLLRFSTYYYHRILPKVLLYEQLNVSASPKTLHSKNIKDRHKGFYELPQENWPRKILRIGIR